jgi:hypothetical protein
MPGGMGCNGKLGSLTPISEDRWRGRNDARFVAIVFNVRPGVIIPLSGSKRGANSPDFCSIVKVLANFEVVT